MNQSVAANRQEQIAPCPFCGKQPEVFGSGEAGKGLMIECITKNCPNPSVSYYDHASAIAAWNRRTVEAAPTEPVALTDERIRGVAVCDGGGYQDDKTAEWTFSDAGLRKFARALLAAAPMQDNKPE